MNISITNLPGTLFTTVLIILMSSMSSYGQYTINGPSPANQGQTYQYNISGASYNSINWQVYYGGNIVGTQSDSYVSVVWTVATSGTLGAVITDNMYNTYYLSKNVTINPTTPSTPPAPTVQSTGCGSTVLARSAPPTGITYYWQSSASGTSTSNSGSTITKSSSGTQYLRARNNTGTWSTSSSSVAYTVNQVPSAPTGQDNYRCGGAGTAYISATPGNNANSIRWYSASSGGTLLHTGTSYITPSISSTTTYYAQSYNSSTGCVSPNRVAVTATVYPILNPGAINGAKTICYNNSAGTLGNTTSPSGGDGSYAYQWQVSSNNSTWSNVSGATGNTYSPGTLTATRWYRRKVVSCTETKYTSSVKVTVRPALNAGSITGAQTICYNGNPSALGNSSAASGGDSIYSYQWQASVDGSSWSNISGATAATYDPGALTSDRWYRRAVSSCGQTLYTSNVKVTVRPALNAGSITGAQTICYNGNPSALGNSSAASGGDSSYSYQWQISGDGTSWSNISGATAITYDPGTLTSDRWYRRAVSSCGQTLYTSNVKVTVRDNLTPGAINGTKTICSGSSGGTLGNVTSPTGGDGSYSYLWQQSSDNSSWSNISGATSSTYAPGNVTATRWYRRQVASCSQTTYSTSVKITTTTPPTWYADTDGDGYGNGSASQQACSQPSGYVSNNSDYDDTTNLITNIPPQYFYKDDDGDGFGDPNDVVYRSVQPTGYVTNSTDICPTVSGPNSGCTEPPYQAISLSNENYIYTRSYQTPMTSSSGVTFNKDVVEQITYFDGLGRPKQSIGIKQSPDETDIITHIGYDEFGRQTREHLPYQATGALASFRTNAETATNSHYLAYYAGDLDALAPNPFSEKEFEPSPLNRIIKQAAPGEAWALGSGHEIGFEYDSNDENEVRLFTVNLTTAYVPTLVAASNSYYTPNTLYKTVTKDENWTSGKNHTTEEFKDKQGRVVLKRTYNNSVAHDTYYVYDDYGNLTYVIPPKVNTADGVSATELSELCYQYIYDERNRLIEKKIPGKGWEYIIYNKLDQPIMTQDANQAAKTPTKEWLFTKYDAFGRVAYTGKVSDNKTRAAIQTEVNNSTSVVWVTQGSAQTFGGTTLYYNNGVYPATTLTEIYTVSYYDTYTDTDGLNVPATVLGQPKATNTKGLPTVSRIKVLGTSNWVTSITGYDQKGRGMYSASKNSYLGTTDIVETLYDFGGKVLESKTTHTKGGNTPIVTIDTFTYDHAGRMLTQTQTINGGTSELIVENHYDELGQLESKGVGNVASSTNRLQTVDYIYNIRGWLKQINNPITIGTDLFAFKIGYNEGSTPLYNGNISLTQWKTKNTDQSLKIYNYIYDPLNRILSATGGANTNYDVSGIMYDKNGNIMALNRNGWQDSATYTNMDVLDYNYDSGNKLLKVADTGNKAHGFKDGTNTNNDFEYDPNGNLKIDRNKGITNIAYNHLNLPTQVTFASGNIQYFYSADGTKQKKVVSTGTETLYAGNYIYEGTTGNAQLQFFNHPEGYVMPKDVNNYSAGFDYVYNYVDHLGNIRLSYSDTDGNGVINAPTEIIEENNYYPFGLEHRGYNNVINGTENNYQTYQGKENQKELGLNWLDFGARNYDASIGRWMNPDPLADLRYELTPYNYVQNSPMFRIDPDGLTDYKLNKETGEVEKVQDTEDKTDRVVKTDKNGNVKRKGEGFLGFLVRKSEIGKAKTAFGGIEKGILKDGQNFKTDDNIIEVGGENPATVDGVKSFTLKLSEYIGKEIKGFSYSSDGSGNVSDMLLGKYATNDYKASGASPTELFKKYRDNYSHNNIVQQFHTHPDGKLGATQSNPELSQDVRNLQRDKPRLPNATFIILYRINNQNKPAEYNYDHHYRSN